ncbi:hypothetical protein DXG01_009985 [Tephrocybe rancida]|nr:hypothetical protein DXG01_009985 [Tephrocybe rancida]
MFELPLPPDLMTQIMAHLHMPEYLSLFRAHPDFKIYIEHSLALQYRFRSLAAGVIDNPHSAHSLPNRLGILKSLEKGWSQLSFDFQKDLRVAPQPAHTRIRLMNEGVFIMGKATGRVELSMIHCTDLPSTQADEMDWTTIWMDEELVVLDFGFSVVENDLMAVVIIQRSTDSWVMEVSLLQLSTGKPHPLAQSPVVFIQHSKHMDAMHVQIQVSGNNMAIITQPLDPEDYNGIFMVFDWKTSITSIVRIPFISSVFPSSLSFNASVPQKFDVFPKRIYTTLTFLTPTLLLLPNLHNASLDLYSIPSLPNPSLSASKLLSFNLPPLRENSTIVKYMCLGGPAPRLNTEPCSRPFHTSGYESLIVLSMHISPFIPSYDDVPTMVVHRYALARLCAPYIDPATDSAVGPPVLKWEEWGPGVTRWLYTDNYDENIRRTNTAGQRCAFRTQPVPGKALVREPQITIYDFNLLRAQVHRFDTPQPSAEDERVLKYICNTPTTMVDKGFRDPIVSSLPYVATTHVLDPELAKCRILMIDEERVVGLEFSHELALAAIKVFHVGASSHAQ